MRTTICKYKTANCPRSFNTKLLHKPQTSIAILSDSMIMIKKLSTVKIVFSHHRNGFFTHIYSYITYYL